MTDLQGIVAGCNATETPYDVEAVLPDLIEEQARIRPEHPAVIGDDGTITYGELDRRANRIAWALRAAGIGPEACVGIHLSRSTHMVTAIVGIMKAGAAYVPLDEDLPPARLSYLLNDAAAMAIVTENRLAQRFADWRTVLIEEILRDGALTGPPPRELTPHSLAYIIYTSGSTGVPKGVMIEHTGVVNLARWHGRQFEVTSTDRATITARLGFDATVWEMWPYLAAGATLYVAPELGQLAPTEVRDWLLSRGITMCWLPPALTETLIDLAWPASGSPRVLFTGSDRLSNRPPATFPALMFNVYGPTETTVISTCAPVEPMGEAHGLPSIGRPFDNQSAYVLDDEMRLLPVDEPGELYLGGVSLARGYLGQPGLTAEKFVPDSFSGRPGARLYRTGDVVSLQPDGTLRFIGRADDQVKIRGYRVELGEVGLTLRGHPAVSQAEAVVVTVAGVPQLVAFAVTSATDAELRAYCAERLPSYMMPSHIVPIDGLPLTDNQKVDRDRLVQLVAKLPQPAAFTPPQTDTERLVARIWQSVLGLDEVDVETNFAELGGHSLLAMRVHTELEAAYPTKLRLVDLFAFPTVRAIAAYLDAGADNGAAAGQDRGAARRARVVNRS